MVVMTEEGLAWGPIAELCEEMKSISVGCGRCISWCPVGIDLTEEIRAFDDEKDFGPIK
jgi:ferredoxin